MTKLPCTLAIALCAGCAPPPVPTQGDTGSSGAPQISILFPYSASAEEQLFCTTLVIVVDIDNVELVRGEGGFPDEDVAGQGHWHLKDNDTYVQATEKEWIEWPFEEGDHRITAALATNTHEETGGSDSVEITVGNSEGCIGSTASGDGGGADGGGGR